jgi:hypothetical protein
MEMTKITPLHEAKTKNQTKKKANHLNHLITKFLLEPPLELSLEWSKDDHMTGMVV